MFASRHEKEFALNLSFTYTVVSPSGDTCLGCVYVLPPEKAGFDAQVIYWARTGSGIEAALGAALRAWLQREWPWWPRVAFPGRDIPWDAWAQLPPPPAQAPAQ